MRNKNELTQKMMSLITSNEKIKIIIEKFLDLFQDFFFHSGWTVLTLDEDTGQFHLLWKERINQEQLDEIDNLIEEGIIDWAMKRENPVFIPFTKSANIKRSPEEHFFIIPLKVNEAEIGVIITICLLREEQFMQEEIELLSSFARQIAFLIDNYRLKEKLRYKRKEKIVLSQLSQIIVSTQKLENFLKDALDLILEESGSEYGFILKVEKKEEILSAWVSSGISLSWVKSCPFSLEKGAIGYVTSKGKPLIIDDYVKDIRFRDSGEFTSFLPKTLLIVPLKIAEETVGILSLCDKKPFYTNYELEIMLTVASYTAMAIKNRFLYEDLHQSFLGTIRALIQTVEAKDRYTSGHSRMVTRYSLAIGKYLNLPPEDMDMIKFCGLLHDIGKIGISENVLEKPSILTQKEYKMIKKHPLIGEQIVKEVKFLKPGLSLIRHHHERYNGKGYPDRLKGENIPLLARIVTVADAFDAMISDRPYRKTMNIQEAIEELKRGKGTQFDPKIVDVFCKMLEERNFDLSTFIKGEY